MNDEVADDGSMASSSSTVLLSTVSVAVAVAAGCSTPAGWSSGVAVVTVVSGTGSGTGAGCEAISPAGFEGVLERPHVHGAYQEPCRTAEEERTTLGVDDAPARQFDDRREFVRREVAESAVLLETEENYR